MRSILDTFEEGVCLIDEAGYVCCLNAAAEELVGYTEKELLGGPFLPNVKIALLNDTPVSGPDSTIKQFRADDRWRPFRLLRKDGNVFDALCARWPLEPGSSLLKFRRTQLRNS